MMRKIRKLLFTLVATATLLATCAVAQTNLTQIRDTIYNSDGTPFNGTIVITWNGYSTTLSGTISPLSTSARIYNGALSVLLVPTTTAAANSYYQVVYASSNGTTQWTETWQVPPSANALSVSGVRTSTTTGNGSTGGTGSGSGTGASGSGSGSSQYATLPISMSQVTGLTTSLNSLGTSVGTNTSDISTLKTNVASLTSTVSGLSSGTGSGSGSGVVFVDAEVPGGNMDGLNSAFTLAAAPFPYASLELYRNGLLERPGIDFTLTGTTITFVPAQVPKNGDVLQAYYRLAGSGSAAAFADGEAPAGTINGANGAFTLSATPLPAKSLKLYKNGMLLEFGGDYTLNGSSITVSPSVIPQSGDSLAAFYRY